MSESQAAPMTILVIGGIGLFDVLAAIFLAWAPVAQGWGFDQPVAIAGWQATLGEFCGTFLGICGVSMIAYAGWMRLHLFAASNE
jgi:hypothetical protein